MKKVIVVFGDFSQDVAEMIGRNYNVIKTEKNLDGLLALCGKLVEPDVLLTDGTVLSSMNEGRVNRSQNMLQRLQKIRSMWPRTKVILILPVDAPDNLMQVVTYLGIYNVYRYETLRQNEILGCIEQEKDFSNVSAPIRAKVEDIQSKPVVEKEVVAEENNHKGLGSLQLVSNFKLTSKQVHLNETLKKIVKSSLPEKDRSQQNRFSNKDKPSVILGFGNKEFTNWFNSNLSEIVTIVSSSMTPEEFKLAVQGKRPDLVITMRLGPTGGIPAADDLTVWASQFSPAVLFIAGELDEEGQAMSDKVKSVNGYVLACPPGETISGSELVYLVQGIAKNLVEKEQEVEKVESQPYLNLDALKKGAAQLSHILKDTRTNPRDQVQKNPPVNMINAIKDPTGIISGGLFAVVSPWRPALAGRIIAQAAKMLAEEGSVAVIGATGYSTSAVWLGIPDEELIMSDWRVPGSQAPVIKENMKIWAVDPAKSIHMNIKEELLQQIKEVRKTASYTVLDFAGDSDLVQTVAFQKDAVILFIVAGDDLLEQRTSMLWLNRLMEGKRNIVVGIDARENVKIPEGLQPKFIIRTTPEDAIKNCLRKNLNEFLWN